MQMKGKMKILPFIHDFLSVMQKGCTVWCYLCIVKYKKI